MVCDERKTSKESKNSSKIKRNVKEASFFKLASVLLRRNHEKVGTFSKES